MSPRTTPTFIIDLGDTFAMDKAARVWLWVIPRQPSRNTRITLPYFNIVSGSSPIYLVPGNHEQQEAWHLTASNTGGDPANSLPVMGKNAEKKYFLNPVPDSFYTGDTSTYSYLSGDQLKQDYYAWTWGDALFVVISPFWTTTTKPYTTGPGGGEDGYDRIRRPLGLDPGTGPIQLAQDDPAEQHGQVQVRLRPSNRGGQQRVRVK